ncbi:hypothetical protein EBR57_10100, partial [bacterium]|nr:hypothetical protein [bacterium]
MKVLSLAKALFSKSQLEVIATGIEQNGLLNVVDGWSMLHICSYLSDTLTLPNPAFSHPLLKDMLIEDGIVDPVEQRTIDLMELCQLLVKNPDQIDGKDPYGRRPIDLTTYAPLVDLLMANGASLSGTEPISSPLHVSATLPYKDPTIHLAKGADPSHLDSKNRPALSLVLFNDYLDEVKIGSLVEASKAVLNTKDVFGNFPQSYAVLTQSSQTVAHIAHFSSLETVQYVVEQLTHSSIIVPDDFITPNNGI